MKKRIIVSTTNNQVYDQRMIKICSFLAMNGLDVIWVGREKPGEKSPTVINQSFKTHKFKCIFGKGFLFYLEFNIRLFFYLITRTYQVSYSVDLDTLPAHALAFLFKGKPIVFDAHEWFTEVPELQNRPIIRSVWKGIEKLFMPAVAQAITVGPALSELLEQQTGIPYLVVRNIPFANSNGFQDAKTLLTKRKENPKILYQGALNKGRGIEAMIDAMQYLPQFTFVIAGEGDLSEMLRNQVKKLGLEPQVKFLGFVPPNELPGLTQTAFIGLNVSQNLGKSYYYSLNNKFFDYAQSALPQLLNPFPEYKNLLNEFEVGVLVENNAEQLVQTVTKLWNDDHIMLAMIESCYQSTQKWTWEIESKELLKLESIWE